MKKRHQFLKIVKLYLETEPSESFVKEQYDKVTHTINLYMGRFSMADLPENSTIRKKLAKQYEKENGVDKMREQMRTLRFILS